jgi:hypothetical protein
VRSFSGWRFWQDYLNSQDELLGERVAAGHPTIRTTVLDHLTHPLMPHLVSVVREGGACRLTV